VAQAILAVERGFAGIAHDLPAGASAFGGSNVAARVEALLRTDRPKRASAVLGLVLVALTGLAAAGAETIHHTAETLLGSLPR
jgi:hypothetical protein